MKPNEYLGTTFALKVFKSISDLCWPGSSSLFTRSISRTPHTDFPGMAEAGTWCFAYGYFDSCHSGGLHQVLKQLRNPTIVSSCFPNPEPTPVLWKMVFGGVRYMTGLPTDTQAAWPRFARLPGNSPGQVSHGLTHLIATQPLGQLWLHWQKKTHPLLIEYFLARLLLTQIFMFMFLLCLYKTELILLACFKLLGSAERMCLHGSKTDWPSKRDDFSSSTAKLHLKCMWQVID